MYIVVQKSLNTQCLTHCLYCPMICTTLYTYLIHGVSCISTLSDEISNMFEKTWELVQKVGLIHITAKLFAVFISLQVQHSLTTCSKYRDALFHTAMSFIPLSIYTVDTKTYLELIAKLTSSLVHNRSDVRILWWPVVWKCCQTHIKHHCLFTKISSGILRSSMSRVVVPWNTLTIGNFCSQTFMGEKWGWCCIRV